MHFSTLSLLAAAAQPAFADFHVFCGNYNTAVGGGATDQECIFFNNPPDCSDANTGAIPMTFGSQNDASNHGLACDGCDGSKRPKDWDVERFEVHNKNEGIFADAGDEAHFTLYRNPDDGGYNMLTPDNESIGTCHRPEDPQYIECSQFVSLGSYDEIFQCETKVTIKDSN